MNSVREYPEGADQIDHEMPLESFDSGRILEKLDLTGLEAAKRVCRCWRSKWRTYSFARLLSREISNR